jgi:uncharacterized caspase-like protein
MHFEDQQILVSTKYSLLKNPVNDAYDMAATLRKLGFEVMHRENVNQRDMEDAIYMFSQSLKKGGVGFFYYAGHGVQVHGRNYLIPICLKLSFAKWSFAI